MNKYWKKNLFNFHLNLSIIYLDKLKIFKYSHYELLIAG